MESIVNKRIHGFQNEFAHKIDNLHYSISRLTNQHHVREKGKFPSQTQQNPRGVHEIPYSSETALKMDEVKAVISLSSGKKVEQPMRLNHLMKLKNNKKRSQKE